MLSDPWIRPRERVTDPTDRIKAATHKQKCRDAGLCICGPTHSGPSRRGIQHGPVVRGNKCQRCIDIHDDKLTAAHVERL